MSDSTLSDHRYNTLLAWFEGQAAAVVAFSGGVDSSLVLHAASAALPPERLLGVIADSPSLARRELDSARQFAAKLGARLLEIQTAELENEQYAKNLGDRCFHCKHTLYQTLLEVLPGQLNNFERPPTIVDGLNLDDLSDERPGRKAAEKLGVKHPLVEAGLRKKDVREISAALGLSTAEKQEMACLSSRLSPGVRVTKEKLSAVESVENKLADLHFRTYRVRLHELRGIDGAAPMQLCRIELSPEEIGRALEPELQHIIVDAAKTVGFSYVTIDLEGYRKGGRPA